MPEAELAAVELPQADLADDTEGPDTAPPPTLAGLLADLETRAAVLAPEPGKRPSRLPLMSIERIEALFQPRPLDPFHLAELKAALAVSEVLDPVTVVGVGASAVLVDGHHRVRTYEDRGFKGAIPVRWWPGSVREAVLEASRENGKAKLTMTKRQLMDRAWRLTTAVNATGRHLFTKAQVHVSTGVSNGQVGRLRAVAAKLRELGQDPADFAEWWRAERASRGEPDVPWDDAEREEWEETKAQDFTRTLAKTFGPMLARHPGPAARAVALYFATYASEGEAAQASPLGSFYASLRDHLPDGGEDDIEDAEF